MIKNEKANKMFRITCFLALGGYLCFLFYFTILSRAITPTEQMLIHYRPFSSYIAAWHQCEFRPWYNIVGNILMFFPLGFLCAFLWPKKISLLKVILIGCLLSLVIEIVQVTTYRGIAEIDDIINNTFGTLCGYCIQKILFCKDAFKRKIFYLLPFCMATLACLTLLIVYQTKEFGNFRQYSQPINMHGITVDSNVEFSTEQATAPVFNKLSWSIDEAMSFAKSFAEQHNIIWSDASPTVFEDETLWYKTDDKTAQLIINTADGTYEYNKDEQEEMFLGFSENEIHVYLENIGVNISEDAVFSKDESVYYLQSPFIALEQDIYQGGEIELALSEDGKLLNLAYALQKGVLHSEVPIKSEQEAFQEIQEGKFISAISDISDITIENLSLIYVEDSKSFLQPYYQFSCKNSEGTQWNILIRAMK